MYKLSINDAYFVLNEIRGLLEEETINIRDKEILNRIINIQKEDLTENAACLIYNTICNEPLTTVDPTKRINKAYAYALAEYFLNRNKAYISAKDNDVVCILSNVRPKTFNMDCIERWLANNCHGTKDESETVFSKGLILRLSI